VALPVTALYAGLNGLLIVWLAFRVIAARRDGGIGMGDGGDARLARLMRGHGNATETIPLALLLLGLAEGLGAPPIALHCLGALLTLGRLAHALHFTGFAPATGWRVAGMALTLAMITLTALALVAHALAGGGGA
jgi:hypothetical protein